MKFASLLILVLAIAFTIIAFTFFAQAAKIGGTNAMSLCIWAIVWLIAALTSWALFASRLKHGNL